MNFDLRLEGFAFDEEMKEQLMLRCREVVLAVGPDVPVAAQVRQIEGRVQGRVEVQLPGRRISAVVWRAEPMAAVEGAVSAVLEAVTMSARVRTKAAWTLAQPELESA